MELTEFGRRKTEVISGKWKWEDRSQFGFGGVCEIKGKINIGNFRRNRVEWSDTYRLMRKMVIFQYWSLVGLTDIGSGSDK